MVEYFCLSVLTAFLITLFLALIDFVSGYVNSHQLLKRFRKWYCKTFWHSEENFETPLHVNCRCQDPPKEVK